MKNKENINIKLLKYNIVITCGLILCSCASGPVPIPTAHFNEYSVHNNIDSVTKENVTISINVLKPSETRLHPDLFSFNDEYIDNSFSNAFYYYPKDNKGKQWAFTFGFGEKKILTALKVKITNNTSHILRMKDARVYLIVDDEGIETPVGAVTNLGDPTLVWRYPDNPKNKEKIPRSAKTGDESLIHWVTYFENEWETSREKSFLDLPYPVGFVSQVINQNKKHYNLINDVSKEILPNFSYEGILLFPVVSSFETAKLMFYDITTKTDPAGNPIEKTTFELYLDLTTSDMWYDKIDKMWQNGLPPDVLPNN